MIQHRWVMKVGMVLLCFAVPGQLWGSAAGLQTLAGLHSQLQQEEGDQGHSLPLQVRSTTTGKVLRADIAGVLHHSFLAISTVLSQPAAWCDFIPLNYNVKSCVHQRDNGEDILVFYASRKHYSSPDKAYRLSYRFSVDALREDYIHVSLLADKGPMGTADYRIDVEALKVAHETVVRFNSSYRPSFISTMALKTYLVTLGRHKVGFTIVGNDQAGEPIYVKGVNGVVERNAVRYFLALQALLDTRQLPIAQRFEARIHSWFDLTELYSTQLHEMDKKEYVAAKRLERQHQLNLQRDINGAQRLSAQF